MQISESNALVQFGTEISSEINKKIRAFCDYLDNNKTSWLIEYIPAFASVSVIYDPFRVGSDEPFQQVREFLQLVLNNLDFSKVDDANIVKIPVCYGGEFGPDIEYVAELNNLTVKEVIDIHSSGEYLVYMIGFTIGFPYLGGMSEKISAPRRESPRTAIPKGSVGIAGLQTGVYPIEVPGGWQLIGRTPINMFDLESDSTSLLKSGDIVKFYPITNEEYEKLRTNN